MHEYISFSFILQSVLLLITQFMKYSEIVCAMPYFLARRILEAGVSAELGYLWLFEIMTKMNVSVLEKCPH